MFKSNKRTIVSTSKGIKKMIVGDGMGVGSIMLVLVDYYNNGV